MKVPKILHIGLCAGKNDGVKKFSSVSEALMDHCSQSYAEISTGHKNINETMVAQAEKMKPDIIFCQVQAEGILTKEAVLQLRNHCPFVVNWTGDVRAPVPQWYVDYGNLFDVTFFTNMNDVRTLRNKGIASEYLEIGYDPDIYYPDNRDREIDIAFMANNYGGYPLSDYRFKAAQELRNHFGERFKLYGGGWTIADGNLNASQYEEAEVLRNVKIAVSISHFDYDRYSSDRRLRILGSGCLCLSHNHKGLTEDFIVGQNISAFVTIGDMIAVIEYLLSMSKIRKLMASNGHYLAKSEFTFHRMIDRLLEFNLKLKR